MSVALGSCPALAVETPQAPEASDDLTQLIDVNGTEAYQFDLARGSIRIYDQDTYYLVKQDRRADFKADKNKPIYLYQNALKTSNTITFGEKGKTGSFDEFIFGEKADGDINESFDVCSDKNTSNIELRGNSHVTLDVRSTNHINRNAGLFKKRLQL